MASAEAHSTADWKSMELNKKGVNEKLKGEVNEKLKGGVNEKLKEEVNKGDVNKDVSLDRLFTASSPNLTSSP